MIDKKKVSLMTKLAIYEKKEERDALALSRFYKRDYVRFNVLRTWVAATVAFWGIVGIYAFMNFDDILVEINDVDYFAAMYKLLFYYVVVCGLYFAFSSLVYNVRYELAKPGLVKYNSNLKDLIELEGGPMHYAHVVKDSKVVEGKSEDGEFLKDDSAIRRPKVNKTEIFKQREAEREKDREQQIIANVQKRNERIAAKNEAHLRAQQRYEEDRRMIIEKRKQLEQAQMEQLRARSMERMQRQNHVYNSDTERREN